MNLICFKPKVGIYKRKQESKKTRKTLLSTKKATKKKERKHALNQESKIQEKR